MPSSKAELQFVSQEELEEQGFNISLDFLQIETDMTTPFFYMLQLLCYN